MTRFKNGYIINPNPLWSPSYRISPFNTSFVKKNKALLAEGKVDKKLIETFFGVDYTVFESGRQAIYAALRHFSLQKDDEVWIVTTSGNKYISGCVTTEIEKFCLWSRQKSAKTKLIFVNHEFGSCYPSLQKLKEFGLPIIEDRAMSFASQDENAQTGKVGDFVIYSLPKFFPISFGGVLQCNNPLFRERPGADDELNFYFLVTMSHYLAQVEHFKKKQKRNYSYLVETFRTAGLEPRFIYGEPEVPGVFMFRTKDLDPGKLKIFMRNNGVESSVFYDEAAFFIPVHHQLEVEDLNFFYTLIDHFKLNGDQ